MRYKSAVKQSHLTLVRFGSFTKNIFSSSKIKINILENANNDLNHLRKHDKHSYIKGFDLVPEIMIDPRSGTGKPERLKYFEKEVYSRRVNQKDRLVWHLLSQIFL